VPSDSNDNLMSPSGSGSASASGAVVGVGIGTGLGKGLVTKTRACFIYVRVPAIQRIGMESLIICAFSLYRTSLHYAKLHLSAGVRVFSADRTRDYLHLLGDMAWCGH
jgi:hypothetical protein